MLLGLLGRQLALAAQLLDQRVVARQLAQLAVAEEVRAAVADVHDADLVARDQRAGERRAHAAAARVLARELEDAAVRLVREPRELLLRAAVAELLVERVRGDPRGDLAGLRAAHAVGDHVHRRARVVGVLVRVALAAGVGARRLLDDPQHEAHPNLRLVPELGVADPDPVVGAQQLRAPTRRPFT